LALSRERVRARRAKRSFTRVADRGERDIAGAAMTRLSASDWVPARLLAGWRYRAISRKAFIFGLVGLVNTVVDYSVFLLARAALNHSPPALSAIASFADLCRCGSASASTMTLIAPNIVAWIVAVTGSYVMNSSITFAAESQRKLRWRAYLTFIIAGIAGFVANTITLVVAAQFFLLPVTVAKAVAILASFAVNFSLSHFVVFRVRKRHAIDEVRGEL
jgi:putative flippase GtrA